MKPRDLDLLSSYLDGQLKPSDSTRLEARLASDPDLRAVLEDLRSARRLLRQLPMRKAPRNFTLTPKMVGKNPPLPRTYPAFRFVTALASLLLFFTMGLNVLAPQLSQPPNFGYGGGGAPEVLSEAAPAAATEAPATEAPTIQMMPMPTATISAADAARQAATPSEKQGVAAGGEVLESPAQTTPEAVTQPVPLAWQVALAVIVVLGALGMLLMRQMAASRWRRR